MKCALRKVCAEENYCECPLITLQLGGNKMSTGFEYDTAAELYVHLMLLPHLNF